MFICCNDNWNIPAQHDSKMYQISWWNGLKLLSQFMSETYIFSIDSNNSSQHDAMKMVKDCSPPGMFLDMPISVPDFLKNLSISKCIDSLLDDRS